MLNIHLTPDVPDPDKFDHETFGEICRNGSEYIKFIMKSDEDEETSRNWKGFLEEIEIQRNIPLHPLWAAHLAGASRIGVIPKNSTRLLELVCMNPTQMYRELIPKIGKFDPIESAGVLFEELNPYSVSANSITIFDRYLIKLEGTFIIEKRSGSIIHKPSLRKLSLICSAISAPVSPAIISIVTELAEASHFMKALKVKSINDPKMSEFFSSPEYKDRTKAIVRQTIEELRRLFPELKKTKFVIYDCSAPSLQRTDEAMPHDRFIGFDNQTHLISSSGFAFKFGSKDESDIWSDLEQLPQNLSNLELLNNTKLPNSTYLVPVRFPAIPPIRSHIITILGR
jgi:hypothetical protein